MLIFFFYFTIAGKVSLPSGRVASASTPKLSLWMLFLALNSPPYPGLTGAFYRLGGAGQADIAVSANSEDTTNDVGHFLCDAVCFFDLLFHYEKGLVVPIRKKRPADQPLHAIVMVLVTSKPIIHPLCLPGLPVNAENDESLSGTIYAQ